MNEQKQAFCPKCGAPVGETAMLCPKCGCFTDYFYQKNGRPKSASSSKSKIFATLSQIFAVIAIATFIGLQFSGVATLLSYAMSSWYAEALIASLLTVLLPIYLLIFATALVSLIFGIVAKNKAGYLMGAAAVTLSSMFFVMLLISSVVFAMNG